MFAPYASAIVIALQFFLNGKRDRDYAWICTTG